MQTASLGDRSHEMSNPILQEKIRKNLINLSSAESAHSVVSNNSQMSVRKKEVLQNYVFPEQWIYLFHPFQ